MVSPAAQTGNHNTPANIGYGTPELKSFVQEEVERLLNLSLAYRIECCNISYAAEKLSVTEDTLRQWIAKGKLPASKAGNNWLIRLVDIDDMLKRYATVVPMKDKRFGVNRKK